MTQHTDTDSGTDNNMERKWLSVPCSKWTEGVVYQRLSYNKKKNQHLRWHLNTLTNCNVLPWLQVSRPHPSDNPLLFLFLVGGVTPSELRLVKEVVSAHAPGTQVSQVETLKFKNHGFCWLFHSTCWCPYTCSRDWNSGTVTITEDNDSSCISWESPSWRKSPRYRRPSREAEQ